MNGAETVNTNIKGTSLTRRRATRRQRIPAGPRAAHGGAYRCQPAGRAMTTTVLRRDGASAVVAIGGEIDVQTAGGLRAALLSLIDGGHIHLVADFTDVRFCDAAGLGALVAVGNRLREKGGTLRLAGVRPAQRKILRITRLDELFRTYDTLDEALFT